MEKDLCQKIWISALFISMKKLKDLSGKLWHIHNSGILSLKTLPLRIFRKKKKKRIFSHGEWIILSEKDTYKAMWLIPVLPKVKYWKRLYKHVNWIWGYFFFFLFFVFKPPHTHPRLQNHQGTKEREIRHRDVLAQMQTNLLGSDHNFKHRTKLWPNCKNPLLKRHVGLIEPGRSLKIKLEKDR